MEGKMDYGRYIEAALNGDSQAFGKLYEATYQNMYYIALKYVKNSADAEDILQDAYVKAYQGLSTLKDWESFPGWLGRIVANTAKNVLARKKVVLFSEMEKEDGEGDSYIYNIEDENIDYQPEINYTRKETQELTREMIDSLSDEQRLCILMFYLDGQSIRDIAETFSVSENTVKSRLNYGRKALKKRGEELQKKGYKLYTVSVLPLLLYLLRLERESAEFAVMSEESMKAGRESILHNIENSAGMENQMPEREKISQETAREAYHSQNAGMDIGRAATGAGVREAMKLTASKIVIALLVASVSGVGVGAGAYYVNKSRNTDNSVQSSAPAEDKKEKPKEEKTSDSSEQKDGTEPAPAETQAPEGPAVLGDEEYPSRLAGNLTKEETEFVLSYATHNIMKDGIQNQDVPFNVTNRMVEASKLQQNLTGSGFIEYFGMDGDRGMFSVQDVNRMLSIFTDFAYTEANYGRVDGSYRPYVEGDKLVFAPATDSSSPTAKITSAEYTDQEMYMNYTLDTEYYEYYNEALNTLEYNVTTHENLRATLVPDEQGLYQIIKIEEVDQASPADAQPEIPTDAAAVGMGAAYGAVLDAIQNGQEGYQFPGFSGDTGFSYFLRDMDGDGDQEMIVGQSYVEGVFYSYSCRVYGCEEIDGRYEAREIPYSGGTLQVMDLVLTQDGRGVYSHALSRGTGEGTMNRVTAENGTLVVASTPEFTYQLGDSMDSFYQNNPHAAWVDITNRTLLENL